MVMSYAQISLFLLLISYGNATEIDDLMNLIIKEQQRAKDFVLPNDSKDSKPYSDLRIEYGTFDHIVVGAGSAGAVVASRLSEDDFRNILLLEAGGPDTNFTDILGMAPVLLTTKYNWNYQSTPQTTACLGSHERRCRYPRGKILGGTSSINGMIYSRGSKTDYNNWCAQGNAGWCFADVLPVFKKFENSQVNGSSEYHGYGGNVNVQYIKPLNEKYYAYIDANVELNRSFVDYNGERQEGVGLTQFSQKDGKRHSSSRAFLQPALNRKNLKILTHSHVTRVLISPKTRRAFGVVFARNKRYYVARARKDIVVSAGTIASPQLLMLSGIGPKRHLESIGIPVLQNLDVGENFLDHAFYGAVHFDTNVTVSVNSFEKNVKDYLNGFGDFVDGYNIRALTHLSTNSAKNNTDIEHISFLGASDYQIYKAFFNYDTISYEHGWANVDYTRNFNMLIILLHPQSKGRIWLKSKDPFVYPLIDSNLLSDPNSTDIETLYQGIQLALDLLKTKAMKKINARLRKVHLPACKHLRYLSKKYWYCQIRQLTGSLAQLVGTCKMGPNPMQGAVVNDKLQVHGIKNLRVADASVMPTHLSAHMNAPAMMIGEKAAHMIRFE